MSQSIHSLALWACMTCQARLDEARATFPTKPRLWLAVPTPEVTRPQRQSLRTPGPASRVGGGDVKRVGQFRKLDRPLVELTHIQRDRGHVRHRQGRGLAREEDGLRQSLRDHFIVI